ncbi:hypothetical protein AR687_24565 [Flavobacteriaceae bacterium CRH]|nr:hypothetical protein AR687_24565 [Flavobacteriaceae bacterium CRH]
MVVALSRKLGWSHFIELLPIKNHDAMIFYANQVNSQLMSLGELFKANKSIIYRIMRKYIYIYIYIYDSTEKDSSYDSRSLGEFKIVAKIEEDLAESLKKFCETFKIMYKLNYELWKITDLKKKKVNH